MTSGIPENERELVAIADAIKTTMSELSERFHKTSQLVGKLQASAQDPFLVEHLLSVRAGIASADTRLFTEVAEKLLKHDLLYKQVISPETMRRLTSLQGDAGMEAIGAITNGQTVDMEKLGEVETFVRWLREGDERTDATARARYLDRLASRSIANRVDAFQELSDELISTVNNFVNVYVPANESEGVECFTNLIGYSRAHRDVSALATLVITEFDATFGSTESLLIGHEGDPEERLLGDAYRALKRFVEGRFAHNGGFAKDVSLDAVFSREIVDALDYLGRQSPGDLEQTTAQSHAPDELRVLEFGAGAGGMAIGLMAGGFHHVGIFEGIKTRVDTLRKNWPEWAVSEDHITGVSDDTLEQHRGIDLLAVSIPGQPFARKSTPDKRLSENDHLPDAVRAIRIVRPRAFIFHVVETLTFAQHAMYLARACSDLSELGYRVEQVLLQPSEFGLPQKVERLVIVGIRSSERGTFLKPSLIAPVSKGVGEVLGPILTVHKTPENLKAAVTRYSDQWHYDEWAKDWPRWFHDKLLPKLPVTVKEDREGPLAALKSVGFDGSSYAQEPPKVGEFQDNHMLPKLTVPALAGVQGFPTWWSFEAELGGNVDMIAESLPPVLAKVLALRIYSALTGWRIDLDAALAEPIIQPRISTKRRLRLLPNYHTANRIALALEYLEGASEIQTISDPVKRSKAHTLLIKSIIRSKRGNGADEVAMERDYIMRIAELMTEPKIEVDYPNDDLLME